MVSFSFILPPKPLSIVEVSIDEIRPSTFGFSEDFEQINTNLGGIITRRHSGASNSWTRNKDSFCDAVETCL